SKLGNRRVAARAVTRASKSRWPRCTPSNVPTVITAPNDKRGKARALANASVIGHHEARVQSTALVPGDRNERTGVVDQGGKGALDSCVDGVAMSNTLLLLLRQSLVGHLRNCRSKGDHSSFPTFLELSERECLLYVEHAA